MTPDDLLLLANLTVARKPDRGPTIHPDPLASPEAAAQALSLPRLGAVQLAPLRELHKTVVALVDDLLTGRSVARAAERLTQLAQPSSARVRLEVGENQALQARVEWSEPTPAATLARRAAMDLGEIDVTRLKRCERPACNLVFYDTTRSATQRWHAESPCGARERQRRYRAAAHAGSPTQRS